MPSPRASSSVTILVVEDHEEDFHFLSILLKRPQLAETYELDWAGSFDEGVERLRTGRYDVGLFDYSLGGGTGLDLLRRARAGGAEDMPIILLTGVDNPHIDDEALETGAADYLCKVGLNSTQLERSIRYARKQTATLAELRRTSLLLDGALSYLPVIAGRVDADGSIREARGRGLELLSLTEEELIGVNTFESWSDVAPHIRVALDGGESEFTREIVRHGVRRHFDNYFRFDHSRGHGAIGFAVDVTTRVEAEKGRRRQAGLLDSILRNLPVLAGRLDLEGRVVEASGEGLLPHQMAPAQLLGHEFAARFPQSRRAIAEALAGGNSSFTLGGFRNDEEWSVDFFVSFDSEQGAGATFFGRDLTERRLLERQLLKISDAEQQRIGADL
ncbi:MAG: PAS domain-containing protein, partial [Burkholderiales bacterium]|nr:PAS domain-containing protein [Opitutaceae bacterium]